MSMLLISEKLLQDELDKKPKSLNDQQDFYYSMIEKELYLIKRLNIEMCDMRGEIEEVADRLEHSEIAICSCGEIEDMRNAMQFKYEVMNLINKY